MQEKTYTTEFQNNLNNLNNIESYNCPDCNNIIPVYKGFSSWCDKCKWNLKPYEPNARYQNVFDKLYLKLSKKLSDKLFKSMVAKSQKELNPHRLTFSRFLTFALATAIYLVDFFFFLLGLLLCIGGWPSPIAIGLGLLCFATLWYLRPKSVTVTTKNAVSRSDYPQLYALVDHVADALHTSRVDVIKVTEHYNAAIGEYGWRKSKRKKILYLGLPMLTILNDQEKIALLAHELSHSLNGDLKRGPYIRVALSNLIEIYHFLVPDRGATLSDSISGPLVYLSELVSVFFSKIAAWFIYGLINLFSHLLFVQSQIAEYYADAGAAKLSGTQAVLALLEKSHYTDTYALTVQKVALNPRQHNFFQTLQAEFTNVPAREIERLQLVSRLYESRLDNTHPPTAYRIEFLSSNPQPGTFHYQPTSEQRALLNKEIQRLQDSMQQKIVDNYLGKLYY